MTTTTTSPPRPSSASTSPSTLTSAWSRATPTRHLRFTSNDYNFFPAPPADVQSENDTKQFYTRLTAHGLAFDGVLESTLGVAYGRSESDDFTPGGFPPESTYTGSRVKADYQGNIHLASTQTLVVGVEHQRDEIQDPISANTTINSGYAELQSAFSTNFFNTLSVRYDDNDRFGSKVTYRIAPVYTLSGSGTMLKATLGTGFKAPTLSQMFQDFPDFGFFGNPNLKPERSVGYDVGFEQPFANDVVPLRRHLLPQRHQGPDRGQRRLHLLHQHRSRGDAGRGELPHLPADQDPDAAGGLHLHRGHR